MHLRKFLPFQKTLHDLELPSYSAPVFFFSLSLACKEYKHTTNVYYHKTSQHHNILTKINHFLKTSKSLMLQFRHYPIINTLLGILR